MLLRVLALAGVAFLALSCCFLSSSPSSSSSLSQRAVLAHVERIEQVVDDVAEPALVLDQVLEPVEIAAGALLDQRRHRSTSFFAAGGGARPVSRSRTISASASSIGASARSVTSSNLPR